MFLLKEVSIIAKKLEDGMWSTKWILPEHLVGLVNDQRNMKRFPKPSLDEQEIQMVDAVIRGSYLNKLQIVLHVYDIFSFRVITGTVEKVDHQFKQVKVVLHDPYAADPDYEWIPLEKICKAELVEVPEWTDEEKETYNEAERNDQWDNLDWDRDEHLTDKP